MLITSKTDERDCLSAFFNIESGEGFYMEREKDDIRKVIEKIDSRICKFFDCSRSDLFDTFSKFEIKKLRIKFCE